jgi:hypothetical protein
MRMQVDGSRRSAGGAELYARGCRLAAAGKPLVCLTVCLMAAGCGSIGQALGPAAPGRDVSIAFESIDGLPRDVSPKLAHDLDEEAAALRIAVIPAGGQANYRIRGYLAAHAESSGTAVAWAWDVYDAGLQRAFRLNGEERAGAGAGRNWAADDALLRRIAHNGMAQLADFMASPPAPPAAPPPGPEQSGGTVAGSDELRPGIRASLDDGAAALAFAGVPLPPRRPTAATGTTRLADATSGR